MQFQNSATRRTYSFGTLNLSILAIRRFLPFPLESALYLLIRMFRPEAFITAILFGFIQVLFEVRIRPSFLAHNGMCYHKGKSTKLDTFTIGDIVTLKLDLTNRKLLISLNGGLFREGFSCLPRNETFYAFASLSDTKGNRTDEIRIVRYPR